MTSLLEMDNETFSNANNDDFCACCLSTNIGLVNLLSCKHLSFFTSIPNFVINHKIKHICAVCHSMLVKFAVFKQQVIESFQLLNSQSHLKTNRKINNLQRTATKVSSALNHEASSSTLQIDFTREPYYSSDERRNIYNVKGEIGDSDNEERSVRHKRNLRSNGGATKKVYLDLEPMSHTSDQAGHISPCTSESHFETVYTNKNDGQTFTTNTVLHNQQIMLENLKAIMIKLDSISDLGGDPFSNMNQSYENSKGHRGLKQVESIEDLEALENQLKDDKYREQLIEYYSGLCNPGPGLGTNCAYNFIDVMFSRQFLCQCSWAGGSRTENTKIAFKQYRRTIEFFNEMIRFWDPTYTLEETDAFLKSILRNSKTRFESKRLRRSAKKYRTSQVELAKRQTLFEAIAAGDIIVDSENENGDEENSVMNIDLKQPV